jgi:23S rRNA (cytosine1962-C5)-methyltransferase
MTLSTDTPHAPPIADAAVRGTVVLKPRRARPFFARHPWVLDSAIKRVDVIDPEAGAFGPDVGAVVTEASTLDGAVVDVTTSRGEFVGRGIFNGRSRIRIRLYTFEKDQQLDRTFWHHRLETAIDTRRSLGLPATADGAARLVFSEADGLSGLIVDRYADYLVVQPTALACATRLDMFIGHLTKLLDPRGIVLRADSTLARLEGFELEAGTLWGELPADPLVISEHGIRYYIDLEGGQKTGAYLDQRDNHRQAAQYLSGRRVLDMFCYTGGFALAASMLGKAASVVAVDSSRKAIETAEANARLNGIENIEFRVGSGFETLDGLVDGGEQFEAVVLDPPKFASGRHKLDDALRAYHRINRQAVRLLPPGGILVTCSCSGSVTPYDFVAMLAGVSQRTGRDIQILESRGASPDHPIRVSCLENEYLKCFICRVG